MKKFFVIGLIFIHLFSTTEIHQLIKIPYLVNHFNEHLKENNQLSFISYLQMHYSNASKKNEEPNDDSKLPFKCHQDNHPNIEINLPKNSENINFKSILIFTNIKQNFIYNFLFTSNFQISIWQPPKINVINF